jgi:hypothetical protein
MSHGSQRTIDLMYGNPDPAFGKAGDVDVTQLMNLAKHPEGLDPFTLRDADHKGFREFNQLKKDLPKIVAEAPALLNADSYALAIGLLNQRSANYPRFLENLGRMRSKFDTATGKHITEAVIINLSTLA